MKKVLVLLFILISTGQSAYSQSAINYWYGGISSGVAFDQFDVGSSLDVDESLVVGAQLGLRLFTNSEIFDVAYELNIRDYDEFEFDTSFGSFSGEIEMTAISLRAKFYFSDKRVQPYAYLGAGYIEVDISDDFGFESSDEELMFEFGGGVEIALGQRFALFFETDYVLPQGDLVDFEFWEIRQGFNIKF